MRTDQDLIGAYLSGDSASGEAMVDRYYGVVLGFFRNKAPASAQELTRQTFTACFRGLADLEDAARFRAHLLGIACEQLRAHYRRSHGDRLSFSAVSAVDLDPSPSLIVAREQRHQRLIDGLRTIPVEHQVALELRYWEDLSGPELAEVLEVSLEAAEARIREGRELLSQALQVPHGR